MAAGSKAVIYTALAGNFAIAVTKFGAAAVTGSSAMLSEAVHSVVDTGNQGLLLWGLRRSRRPPSAAFPLGHGKEVYFWSFVVAILIFALGAGVSVYEGIKHVMHPRELTDPTVNYVVLAIAMVFEGAAWLFAWKGFRKAKGHLGYLEAVQRGKDPTIFVVLFEDSAAMAGLIVAAAGIALGQATGIHAFDGIASIVIGLILGSVALWLAIETKGLLIGESAPPEVRRRLGQVVRSQQGIASLNELVTLHMGPESLLVAISVDFVDGLSSEQVEASVATLNRRIREAAPEASRVFIEVESFPAHRAQVAESRKR